MKEIRSNSSVFMLFEGAVIGVTTWLEKKKTSFRNLGLLDLWWVLLRQKWNIWHNLGRSNLYKLISDLNLKYDKYIPKVRLKQLRRYNLSAKKNMKKKLLPKVRLNNPRVIPILLLFRAVPSLWWCWCGRSGSRGSGIGSQVVVEGCIRIMSMIL